jgi:uncharacterized delta-60 repeat protein
MDRPTVRVPLTAICCLSTISMLGQAGTLDPAFSGDGIVLTALNTFGMSECHSIAIQPDGKIVAAGSAQTNFALARYLDNGSLDPTFSTDGKTYASMSSLLDQVNKVLVQPDGKIIAIGTANNNDYIALARFNTDGTLDTSFSQDGKVLYFGTGAYGYGGALQADGKILACGPTMLGSTVIRLLGDGSVDSTFGAAGVAILADLYDPTDIVIRPDGRLLVTGSDGGNAVLAQLHVDGQLDSLFGTGGLVVVPDLEAGGTALRADGSVVVAGGERIDESYAAVLRYDSLGSLDTTFGNAGRARFTTTYSYNHWHSLLIQPDDRIVVAGSSGSVGVYMEYCTARLEADGSLDLDYGQAGWTFQSFGTGMDYDSGFEVQLQPDGKIVVGGSADYLYSGVISPWFGLLRYLSDLSVDVAAPSAGRGSETRVYPNPASGGTVTVRTSQVFGAGSTVRLFDARGARVFAPLTDPGTTGDRNRWAVDVSGLAPGVYVLRLIESGQEEHVPLVRQ